MKILAICASGVGTSMIMKKNIKELVEKLGIEVEEVKSSGLEESKKIIDKFDLVFCSEKLAKELEANPKIKVLKNLLDVNELKNYLQEL
ncbi:PTS sugar transporter subunit IIB [Fusobacterium periodonticum]|jgi:ascorbate-specific PTS system EIIB component|uniref:PTS sugar transporter subunit IIB n=1 Tax=Fusobacterium periodonticum TaxID=860 RepID=UPI0028D0A27C|nr:PTS sugar transporter subunit IIB [Fusobacterium periodonticum]